MRFVLRVGWMGLLWLGLCGGSARALVPQDADVRARMVERYESILAERPRKGPALRSLYKLHVEALTADAWLDDVEARAAAYPEDARRWLLAGLVLQEHGNEERARPYLEQASRLDPTDWYAPFCLGESDLYANRYDSAIERLTTASERARERENLVVVYTVLGRAYLRAGRTEEARRVWDQVVELRPDDTQTIEELAELLSEEDHAEAAVQLYERLRGMDGLSPYQRVHYVIRLARMKVQVDQPEEALALYQEALARVGPDSWLYDEIYAQIEGVYREQDRLDDLVDLYRERLRQRPREVELALRLADSLALGGDPAAALETLEAAVERAPSRADLRRALADQYLRAERFADAIHHLERLVRDQPESSEHRLQLARAWLRRVDAPDSRARAKEWVLSLSESGPQTAETFVRVAEALAELNFRDEAAAWYRRAVEQAPGVGEYHEYLGEHLLQLGRREEALAAFGRLAEGERRSAPSLARLADVLAYHSFEDEALDALREAIGLEPANFDIGVLHARHLDREGLVDEALAELDRIEELAPNEYFRDDVIDQRIQLLARGEQLEAVYRDLLARLDEDDAVSADDWILAAKMALGLRKRLEARDWIDRAVEQRPDDLRVLDVAERVYRTVGDVEGQLALLERIAEVEPQRRIDVLKRMVATAQRMGDLNRAAQAAQELIDWVPSSPTGYQLMARLKADQGLPNDAFDYLRRAIRAAPGEISLRIELAGMLQSQLMIPEAIETYWQVMDVAEDVSEKLAVVKPLSELYHGQGRFDRLVDRLRRMKRRARDPLPASLALVAAYETVDDLAAARRELMELAAARPADENVLRQLVSLSRREGELARAVAFQRQLVELQPSRVNYRLLGDLLLERNDRDGALSAWQRGMDRASIGGDETEVAQAFEWIEQLERNGFAEQAANALRELHRRHRGDWRVVYRVAVAHADAGDLAAAFPLFRKIIELPSPLTLDSEAAADPEREVAPWSDRFPWPYLLLQEAVAARHVFAGGGAGRMAGAYPGGQPLDLDRAQALALAFIARMEGRLDAVDDWLAALRQGDRRQRRTLLKFALIIHDTPFTRAVSRDILEVYPDDAFARLVSMTPSRLQAQHGVEDEFLTTMREHLRWFKDHYPGYDWFYDWHELRVLTLHGDEEQIRVVAQRLVDRGQSDPFVLAQSMSLLHRAKLYDAFEACIDGALAYYEERGASSIQQQLLNSLGYIAIEILREDLTHLPRALRVFGKYADASRPPEPGRLGHRGTQAWGGGSVKQQLAQPYPQPNAWWDSAQQSLLQRLYSTASNAGREVDLVRHFEHRVDVAEGGARTHAQLALARVYWWSGRPEDTRDVLRDAVRDNPDDDAVRLELARLEQEVGNVREALAHARALSPPFGVIFREVQQWLLQLALDAGDEDAARAPAERLLRMRLSPEEMVDLADHLTSLGDAEQAQRLVQRAERMQQYADGYGRGAGAGGAGLEQRMERLRMHERKGNPEQARLLAQQVLRACRTAAPPQADRYRDEALGVLRRLGELAPLIAEAEARLREQPGALRWVEELFWYYRADGREDAALALLNDELRDLRGAEDFRLRLARLFFDERNFDASADQLARLLAEDPSVFFGATANYWLLNQAFAEAGRADELVAVFDRIEPEDLLGSRRLLHANRTQTVAHLINFARDALHQDGIPPALALRACDLAPSLLSTRQMQETYLPQIHDLAGLAYDTANRPAEAFESFLICIAPPAVLAALGLDPGPGGWPQAAHNVTWAKAAPGSILLRCLEAGRKAGRMPDLEAASRRALEEDQPGARFLLFASVLLQGRLTEAMGELDAAIEDGARTGGRQHEEWAALVHQVTAAQLLRDADAADQAIGVWEAALASPALDRSAGVEESVVQYFVQTCVQAARKDRARDFLVNERAGDLEGIGMPASPDRDRLARLVSSAEHLYELGYSLDAMRLAQQVGALRPGVSDEQLARRAEAVVKKIRENRLAALRDSASMQGLIVQLESEPVSREAGSGPWEGLLWLYQATGRTNQAAALRAEARRVGGDDPEWRYRLAVAAREAGSLDEAVNDYLAVVQADPGRFVADREDFQSAAECFRRAGRMGELTEAFRRTDFRAWIARTSSGGPGSASTIGNLVQLARHAMHRSLDAPELALVLARRLREAIYGRPAYAAHDQSLAETMERAISDMDLGDDERFIEQLDLVAGPAMLKDVAREREPTRMTPMWVLGMQWQEREVRGLLTEILDVAERTGRLAALEAAAEASIRAGDVDNHFLRCLFALRRDPSGVDNAQLHQAVVAASGYRDRPERRAFLLCILGQELLRAERPDDAVGVYEKAVLLAQQSAHDSTALSASFYLAATHLARGRPDDAQRVLLEPPVARWSSNRPDHIHDQRAAAMLMQARKLRSLGFYAAAWRRAAEVQALYAAEPGHRRYQDAEQFLQRMLHHDLPRTRGGGEWDALVADLRGRREQDLGDARLLHQLYRVHEALGQAEEAAAMLQALAALEPADPDMHHLLATIYFNADNMARAFDHLAILMQLDPARLFTGQANQQMVVDVSHRTGRVDDLVRAVCDTAGPRLLGPARKPAEVEQAALGLMSVAFAVQAPPVHAADHAARILEYVWNELPADSRFDPLEKRITQRLVAVYREGDRPADLFRVSVRFTAGSAVAHALGLETRRSVPPDFRLDGGWNDRDRPESAMLRMIEAAGRAGRLDALLDACRNARGGRPLPPHQLLEAFVLLELGRPEDVPFTLPELAALLDRMGIEAGPRILIQAQLGEAYRRAGDPETARYLLRDAMDLARAGGAAADESRLVFLAADAWRAEQRDTDAIDLVMQHEPLIPPGENDETRASLRLAHAERAVAYLLEAGQAAAALRKSRLEADWAEAHAPAPMRAPFQALRQQLLREGLPALRRDQPDRYEADLAHLGAVVERGRDDGAVEDLYCMLSDAGDPDRLRAVEDRLRALQPDNASLLLDMARRAWKDDELERAARLYEELLYLDPMLPFVKGTDYREMAGALAATDRLSVLVEAVRGGFNGAPETGPAPDEATRKQVVQHVIDTSRRLLNADLNAASEARALAETAARACGSDPAWVPLREAADAAVRQAITQLPPGDEAYRAFLPWVATPALADRLGVTGALPGPAWTADWRWHESTIRCFLESFVSAAVGAGRGPEVVEACLAARGAGEAEAMYLAALILLRGGAPFGELDEAVAAGRAAAGGPDRAGPDRMRLLGLLGSELLRFGRTTDAIACFQEAVSVGRQEEPDAGLTYLMLYLSEAWEEAGDVEQAEAVLAETPWPDEVRSDAASQHADVFLQHHYRAARRLAVLGRTEAADTHLRRLLTIEKGSTRRYYHKKARGLLESL